ncbi:SepM family pheromone-processing serine protease [Paenibacillus sp. Marseille-Q4541]|uniref:SepM family pheromone-processing serine protease n=1 Tax=Paenibacillus sp. Marseille-Q4541 TaxID=2831522 RepID=UPI001BA4856C|nr:SepM family pheromone-processing serine protease [Paenibacillus sp. Marseille-Q4541]
MSAMHKKSGLKTTLYIVVLAIMVYVLVYMPTPYIITQPGSADAVKPMVEVKNGDEKEEGEFLMTTVSASYANLSLLFLSVFNEHAEIEKKAERLQGKTKDEYSAEQVYFMSDSQSSAMEAAYEEAEIAYSIVPEHIFVFGLSKDPAPQGDIKAGDKILSVNGVPTPDNTVLSKELQNKKVGDTIEMQLNRSGETITREVTLVPIKDNDTGKTRPGLGVMIGTIQKVKPEDPAHQIQFKNTKVGGPSAGLMFTLEIYNQLTPGDLTKGHIIAGTGTISKEGNVGPIGGVVHKIVAADRKEAEIFFVPRANYADAKKKADAISTDMEIVPVDTAGDALEYLNNLDNKKVALH